MGVVYLAADTEVHDDPVAVKMIHPNLLASHEAQQRFADEVLISRKLTDSGIVRVHDLKRLEGLRFFTMEYIEGRSLREWITLRKDRKPPFTLQEVVSVMDALLKALSYAHQFTIHRDIKPENIMVMGDFPDVQVKVLDFGIAKTLSPSRFTHTAQALGTAYYMAPEQMQGLQEIDRRADLYSVGMILYEMLTGTIAVGRFRLPGELFQDWPEEVDRIVEKALAPSPEERFSDTEAMRSALAHSVSAHEKFVEQRREEWEQIETGKRADEERKKEEAALEEQKEAQQREEIASLTKEAHALFKDLKWSKAEEVLYRIQALAPDQDMVGVLLEKSRKKKAELQELAR